jgi:hypothetical protein
MTKSDNPKKRTPVKSAKATADDKIKVNVHEIDLDRMKLMTSDQKGIQEYGIERGSVAFQASQEGAIKSRAFKVMDEQIDMQMKNIIEQISVLAGQVEDLKTRRKVSEDIYRAKMSFEPLVGDVYYLYMTPKGYVLSILSPDDFGTEKLANKSMSFHAKVKLLADCTWDVLDSGADKIVFDETT